MSRNSQDTLLEKAERLLKAARQHEAEVGGVAPLRDALERAYTQTIFNRQRREVARATAKEATRQLQESRSKVYDAVASLRHFLRGVLGHRSEMLRLFGIEPRKKRSRKRQEAPQGCEPLGSEPLTS